MERTVRHILFIPILMVLAFGALAARLYWMQVLHGDDYLVLAEQNRLRTMVLPAPRGEILDRHGKPIALNRPSFDILLMISGDKPLKKERRQEISHLLGISENDITLAINHKDRLRYEPARLITDAPEQVVALVEENRYQFPELYVQPRSVRVYPYGTLLAHALGYMGGIDSASLPAMREQGYRMGDLVGREGLERYYESYLRGADGSEFVQVNAYEQKFGSAAGLARQEAVPGKRLILGIDIELQAYLEQVIEDRPGSLKELWQNPCAAIVIDPATGEILAMASHPTYDPNWFTGGINTGNWEQIHSDARKPLLNRAVSASFPVGSTFKIITATAGLESGAITPQSVMPSPCNGAYRFGNRYFHCWNAGGHGSLNVSGALKNSCNVFFFQLGLLVGLPTLEKYARMYGVGEPTGIDLPGEATGRAPSQTRMEERYGSKWPKGEILNSAIGQGQVLLSPVQLLMVICTVANGGVCYKPTLGQQIVDADGNQILDLCRQKLHQIEYHSTTLDAIRTGLITMLDRFGSNPLYMMGKTGSAENPHGKCHGWLIIAAPYYAPRVCMVFFFENGNYGEYYIPMAEKIAAWVRDHDPTGRGWPAPPQLIARRTYSPPPAQEPALPGEHGAGDTPLPPPQPSDTPADELAEPATAAGGDG